MRRLTKPWLMQRIDDAQSKLLNYIYQIACQDAVRHSRESGNPVEQLFNWISASAEMTK